MEEILSTMIRDISINYFKIVIEKPRKEEKQIYSAADRQDFGIHGNFWKTDILDALNSHDFEMFSLSPAELSNWFLRYAHALCEYSSLNRPTLKIIHDLGSFCPRASLKETILQKERINSELYSEHLVNNELNDENIRHFFGVLLEIEDTEVLREYASLPQCEQNLDFHDRFGFETHLNEKMLVKIKDTVTQDIDEVVVLEKSQKGQYSLLEILIPLTLRESMYDPRSPLPVGVVKKFSSTQIFCQLNEESVTVKHKKSCDLVFRPSRISIRYQHNALVLLNRYNLMRKYLFPEVCKQNQTTTEELSLKLINTEIAKNPEQLEAVTNIVAGPNPYAPFIIFGPPGTGKTTTIVESIIQLRLQKPESRILVAAGSNAACDTIALRLCEIFNNNKIIQKHLENQNMFPMLRIYSRSILLRGNKNKIPEMLIRRSNLEWKNGKIADPSFESIHRYGIVLATLCTVGKLVRGDVGKQIQHDPNDESNYFTHVFIDEAAASSEPETLIGIMGIKNGVHEKSCRVILSGDHKQLGPVIKSNEAKKHGLEKSLMERLLKRECYAVNEKGHYDRSLQMRLCRNYRSHPEIVRLFNHLYYNNELIAMKAAEPTNEKQTKWSFLPNSQFPIAFQVVYGTMSKDGTASSCNIFEIMILCSYIRKLLRDDQVEQQDIGVITPYKLQCERIKEFLNNRNWKKIEVGSVENFQGREKPIIIASMVRSNKCLGFVRCPRRLNVLLSRPKSLLIILGDPETLSGSEDLKFIINECKINGNYLELNKIKPDDDHQETGSVSKKTKSKGKEKKSMNATKQAKANKDIFLKDSISISNIKTSKNSKSKGKENKSMNATKKAKANKDIFLKDSISISNIKTSKNPNRLDTKPIFEKNGKQKEKKIKTENTKRKQKLLN